MGRLRSKLSCFPVTCCLLLFSHDRRTVSWLDLLLLVSIALMCLTKEKKDKGMKNKQPLIDVER